MESNLTDFWKGFFAGAVIVGVLISAAFTSFRITDAETQCLQKKGEFIWAPAKGHICIQRVT